MVANDLSSDARLVVVTGSPTLTATHERVVGAPEVGAKRRRGSSARCSKHASRDFGIGTPTWRPSTWMSSPPPLGSRAAAMYHPLRGARFLTRDPLVAVTQDPYSYAANDPVNRTDPTGLFDIPGWVPVVGGKCVDIADPDCHSKKDEIIETLTGPGEKSACVAGQGYFVFGGKLDLCLDWNSGQGLSSMRPSISPGLGIGSPSLGVGGSISSHDGACTNSDLGGLGSYVGGSASYFGGQYAENTAPGSDRVRTSTFSIGKNWFPIPEAHAGFDYTWTMNR